MGCRFRTVLMGCTLGLATTGVGQAEATFANQASTESCWQAGSVELSPAQMKARLRRLIPVTAPALYRQMRMGNPILSFKVATDAHGSVMCVQAISGHPLFISAAVEAIKEWRFRPLKVRGQRRPILGTLIVGLSMTKHGLKTTVLNADPRHED